MAVDSTVGSRSSRAFSAIIPIHVFVIGVIAGALLAVAIWWGAGPVAGAPFTVPWPLMALLFAITEIAVIHLRFQRHAHSFSLSEIPLVVGLHFLSPGFLLVSQIAGTFTALAIKRRQQPIKLAFNTAQVAVQTGVSIAVFRLILGDSPPLGWRDSMATLAAVLTALVIADLLVNLAIRISGGRLSLREMVDVASMGTIAALMNAALALVAVHVIWLRPASAWIAVLPPAVLFIAYKAYVSQRQERTRIAAVYDVTKELHRSPQIDSALRVAVAKTRQVFDAELASIVLFPEGRDGDAVETTATAEGDIQVMRSVSPKQVDELAHVSLERRSGILLTPTGERGTARAMAAPLFERDSIIGVILLREPIGEVANFGSTDLTMLETLAAQVSVSLENGRLEDSLAQVTRLKEELHHQALHDGLTGLANRRLLGERLNEAIVNQTNGSHTALLFLDLDDFKTVNDTYGHEAGDDLIRAVADRLHSACRGQDTISRLGGDEFAVLLVGLPRPYEAESVAERILETLKRPFAIQGHSMFVSASLGVAHISSDDDADEILRRADQAMYSAKWRAKGTYEVYADSTSEGIRRWMELRHDLEPAITDGSVTLHYQPIVELETGKIVGAEALIRWYHPTLGQIPPPELLAVAEEIGLMGLIASWTVGKAAKDLAMIQRQKPDFWISVNMSASQLEADLAETVSAAIEGNKLDPSTFIVEITETAATQSSEEILTDIAGLGIRVALDDFGTGYSSLARLDRLPIDILKIDRSFVTNTRSGDGSSLARIVLDIGRAFDLMTIAEGIETPDHRQRLLDLGCRYAQGFLFSRAVPFEMLSDSLDTGDVLAAQFSDFDGTQG